MLREIIEATFDIALDDPRVGIGVPFTVLCHGRSGERTADMFQRSVTTSPWPEAVGYLPEHGFKERLNDLLHGTLYDAVLHGCYAQGSELPRLAGLGYQLPSGRARHISALPQLLLQRSEILGFPKLPDMRDGDPVDARRSLALVRGNSPPGTPQVAQVGYPTPQFWMST